MNLSMFVAKFAVLLQQISCRYDFDIKNNLREPTEPAFITFDVGSQEYEFPFDNFVAYGVSYRDYTQTHGCKIDEHALSRSYIMFLLSLVQKLKYQRVKNLNIAQDMAASSNMLLFGN